MYKEVSRRKFLVGAGAAATLALAGCGSGSSNKNTDLSGKKDGAMDKYANGDQFKATQPLTFSIMMLSNAAYPYKADWLFFTELAKRTNISLQATVIPGSDYNQKRSVMVSAGNAPLIIPKTYHPDEEAYIAGGAILPVSDYLDLMPNLSDKIKKWNLGPDLDQFRQADGKFYLLPGVHEDTWVDYSFAVRTDILQRLNLSVPQTWDDFANMLRAMKPLAGPYPMSDKWSTGTTTPQPGANALVSTLGSTYNLYTGWSYQHTSWDDAAKKFVYTAATQKYKQMLTYLNQLVSEKLLDPESFTQTDDQARSKFASGKSFVISCNAQTLQNEAKKDIAKIPGATAMKIPVPMGPIGNAKMKLRTENGVMISSKAKDSKNFVALMQFVDWLWYSDAGQMYAKWGIQGTTYTGSIDDGSFKLSPNVTWGGINVGAPKNLQVDYGFFNGVFAYGGSTKFLDSQFAPEEVEFQKAMNARKTLPLAPPHPLDADSREQVTLWETALKDYVNQQTLKFILGQRPLSEFDAFVTELKGKNSQQYLDAINKAYENYKKNHG
jgi:putative aldouronate transport system substrate-binding protein